MRSILMSLVFVLVGSTAAFAQNTPQAPDCSNFNNYFPGQYNLKFSPNQTPHQMNEALKHLHSLGLKISKINYVDYTATANSQGMSTLDAKFQNDIRAVLQSLLSVQRLQKVTCQGHVQTLPRAGVSN